MTETDVKINQLQWKVNALKRHHAGSIGTLVRINLYNTKFDTAADAIFESILVCPPVSDLDVQLREPLGMIVIPHGGPHSACTVGYTLAATLYAATGFATLFVNYRGGTGELL
jgi:acetyl esterase/lipase